MINESGVDGVEKIKRNTRLLLGEESDVSYITEALLAAMERNGVDVSSESTFGGGKEKTWTGYRIVDAVRYVAFTMDDGSEEPADNETRTVWLEKPVEVVPSDHCEDGRERYVIRKLQLPAAWATVRPDVSIKRPDAPNEAASARGPLHVSSPGSGPCPVPDGEKVRSPSQTPVAFS